MKKWVKILLWSIGGFFLVVLAASLIMYFMFLKPGYVDEPELSGELKESIIKVDGLDRSFSWYDPAKEQTPNTLLYVFHGSGSNAEEIRQSTAYGFDKIADEDNVVIIYPNGFENHWNDCRGSADYLANTQDIDDIAFLREIEQFLSDKYSTKFKKRFATGHSNGGHFAFKLALEVPEWIDGIAPISANMPVDENLDCRRAGKFVPIILINGTADKINPYEGGLVTIMGNSSRGAVLSTDQTMKYWFGLAECLPEQSVESIDVRADDESSILMTRFECRDKVIAQLVKVVNGGHTIPHPENELMPALGVNNHDINSAEEIWKFFKELD
ncbi:MAG: hypothetical protein JXQ90_19365 [Cyclobacteriaceae bacterium]